MRVKSKNSEFKISAFLPLLYYDISIYKKAKLLYNETTNRKKKSQKVKFSNI